MVAINNILSLQSLRDYLHWIIKPSLFVGWWYTWTYITLFIIITHLLQNTVICVPEVTLCMDTDYWTRLLAKFVVIFYISCYHSIVAYVHLRLRLRLQHLHPSVCYGDYSSAVDLVALRVDLVYKYRASSDTYRSTLQSSSSTDSGCYPSTEAGQDTAPHLHTVPFLVHDHHTAPCSACVAFICIAPWQCRDSSATLRNTLTFNLNCIVVF